MAITMRANEWQRDADDFAARIEIEDLRGFLRRDLTIGHGTNALFFVGGRYAGILEPGRYTMTSIVDRIGALGDELRAAAVVVDAGDVELHLDLGPIFTRDPVGLQVRGTIVIRLEDPAAFFLNKMKGRSSYTRSEVQADLEQIVFEGLQSALGRRSVRELSPEVQVRKDIEAQLRQHMESPLARLGFELVELRNLEYVHEKLDELRGEREAAYLLITEEEAKSSERKRLQEIYDEKELQEIAEATRKAELYPKRAKALADLRAAVDSERFDEIRSKADFDRLVREVDKERLLDQRDYDDLVRDLKFTAETKEADRAHAAEMARVKRETELTLAKLASKRGVLDEEIDLARQISQAKLEKELYEEEARNAHKRAEALKTRQAELEAARIEVQTAETREESEIRIRKQKIEIDRLEDQADLATAREAWSMMMANKREKMLLALEEERLRLDIKIKGDRAAHELEIEKLRALGELSTEALIATSGPEQAQLLADLRRTETLKGMSEEQILALASEKSPEVAKAFQEKYRAASSQEVKDLYDRMLRDKDAAGKDVADRMQAMFDKALETQRDVSVAAAQSGSPSVAYPPMPGQVPVAMPGTPGGAVSVVVCPQCKSQLPTGKKFCGDCGHQVY